VLTLDGKSRNQELLREVNRRIREVGASFGAEDAIDLLCECGDEQCSGRLSLSPAQCDRLLADPAHVLVIAEHAGSLGGRAIVVEQESFAIVAGRIAVSHSLS
jgi:hypothetical protein